MLKKTHLICFHVSFYSAPVPMLPTISAFSLFDTQVWHHKAAFHRSNTETHHLFWYLRVLAFIPSAGKGGLFIFLILKLIPETLSGLTAGTTGWFHCELQEMICSLHASFRILRDSLPALLPFRSPTHFLCCLFFSSLTCSVTCSLIHLQIESLLYCHKSEFCSSFFPVCGSWWQSWRAVRVVSSAAASAYQPLPTE